MKKCKKKKRGKNTVHYCCNPQWFRCGGTVIPPYYLDIVIILQRLRPKNVKFIYKTKKYQKKLIWLQFKPIRVRWGCKIQEH
jgi:hypothetical protein